MQVLSFEYTRGSKPGERRYICDPNGSSGLWVDTRHVWDFVAKGWRTFTNQFCKNVRTEQYDTLNLKNFPPTFDRTHLVKPYEDEGKLVFYNETADQLVMVEIPKVLTQIVKPSECGGLHLTNGDKILHLCSNGDMTFSLLTYYNHKAFQDHHGVTAPQLFEALKWFTS